MIEVGRARACMLVLATASLLLMPTGAQAKTKIKVMTHSYSDWLKQEKIIAANYMKVHPSIEIEIIPYDSGTVIQKYLSMAAAGVQPDLILTNDIPAAELGEKGLLLNLDSYSAEIATFKDLAKSAVDGARKEAGKGQKALWWLPTSIGLTNQFSAINTNMALKAGLNPEKPPSTWDEMIEWARKMTIRGGDGKVTQWGVDGFGADSWWWGSPYIFTAFNGEHGWYNAKEGKAYYNTPEVIRVIQSWADLPKIGIAPTLPGPFESKKSAMALVGHGGAYRTWVKTIPNVTAIPIPGAKFRPNLNYGYAMSRNISKARQTASWDFLRYRVSKEAFLVQWTYSKWDPASSPEANASPDIARIIKSDALLEFGYKYIDKCDTVSFERRRNDVINPLYNDLITKVVRGDVSVNQAMDTLQKKAMVFIGKK